MIKGWVHILKNPLSLETIRAPSPSACSTSRQAGRQTPSPSRGQDWRWIELGPQPFLLRLASVGSAQTDRPAGVPSSGCNKTGQRGKLKKPTQVSRMVDGGLGRCYPRRPSQASRVCQRLRWQPNPGGDGLRAILSILPLCPRS